MKFLPLSLTSYSGVGVLEPSICFGSQQLSSLKSNLQTVRDRQRFLTLSREGPSPTDLHGDKCIMSQESCEGGGGRDPVSPQHARLETRDMNKVKRHVREQIYTYI